MIVVGGGVNVVVVVVVAVVVVVMAVWVVVVAVLVAATGTPEASGRAVRGGTYAQTESDRGILRHHSTEH